MQATLCLFSYGGLEEATIDAILKELTVASSQGISVKYQRISGDALIERSRSRALGRWYEESKDGDVIVMVDHDMAWRPGDLLHVATAAAEKGALVGGLYSKRAFKKGWSSAMPAAGQIEFGKPGLVPTPRLATGFMAIPRSAVTAILDKFLFDGEKFQQKTQELVDAGNLEKLYDHFNLAIMPIADGAWKQVEYKYWDFFRCFSHRNQNNEGEDNWCQFLSEDWAFSIRCVEAGVQSYISTFPIITHYGSYGYTIGDGMDDELRKANENSNAKANKG